MRTIGATCTAAPKRMRCKYIASREYDRRDGGIRRRRRVPVGMASLASQRPTARVAAGGSAKLRLPTCDRRHPHTLSAKTCAVFCAHERQAPIIHPGDQIGRARDRQPSNERKACPNGTDGQRCRGTPFSRSESGCAGRASYLRKAGAASRRRGAKTRPRFRIEPQDVYLHRTTRGFHVGIGRAGPLAPAIRPSHKRSD